MFLTDSNKINLPCLSHHGCQPTPAHQTLRWGRHPHQSSVWECRAMLVAQKMASRVCCAKGLLEARLAKCNYLFMMKEWFLVFVACTKGNRYLKSYLCLDFSGSNWLLTSKNWTLKSLTEYFSQTWLRQWLWNCCGTCLFEGTHQDFVIYLPASP